MMISKERVSTVFLALIYGAAAIAHLIPYTKALVLPLTPLVLAIGSVFCVLFVLLEWKRETLIWILAAYAGLFALEAVGETWGFVFGPHHYGTILGPKLLGVPPVIALTWVIVVLGLTMGAREIITFGFRIRDDRLMRTIAAVAVAAGTLLFDWFVEPVAVGLGYWSWEAEFVPFQNFIVLFVIAGIMSWTAPEDLPEVRIPYRYIICQTAFFVILFVVNP
jgi:bisanhydrobacterioruberin hydratase